MKIYLWCQLILSALSVLIYINYASNGGKTNYTSTGMCAFIAAYSTAMCAIELYLLSLLQ